MGLTDNTLDFVGKLLILRPVYGWGWARHPSTAPLVSREEFKAICPFRARLLKLWRYQGEYFGGVGKVEEPGHDFDQNWVVFSPSTEGDFDFTEHVGVHGVQIGPNEPDGEWPIIRGEGPRFVGYCEIIYGVDA